MKKQLLILFLTGWLVPTGIALVFFARWVIDIVIPTLKGGNFDQLYDLHGIRYLDTTVTCIFVAFVWIAFAIIRWARNVAGTA